MKKEKNNGLLVAIIYLCIVNISGFLKFVTFEMRSFNTFDIKGVWLVSLGSFILLYSAKTHNKMARMISYVISIIGYYLTFTTLNKVIKSLEGLLTAQYEIGYYLYILSAIFLTIIIILTIHYHFNKISNEYNKRKLDTDSFILCNTILGFKDIPYDSLILLKKENNSYLFLDYKKDNNILSIKIPLKDIEKIESNIDLSMDYSNNQTIDNQSANMLLSYSIIGNSSLLAHAGTSLLNELTEDYNKADIKTWYILAIKYMDKKEIKEIKLKTKKNPDRFIEKIKNME